MRYKQLLFSLAPLVFVTIAGAQTNAASSASANQTESLAKSLGVSFPDNSRSTVALERDGKKYLIDVSARTIQEMPQGASAPENRAQASGQPAGATVFQQNCTVCHGPNGEGIAKVGTPNFHDASLQRSLSDQQIKQTIANGKGKMPAWSGKLNDTQIADLVTYIRSFASGAAGGGGQARSASAAEQPKKPGVYEAGDDVLMTLPSGRPTARHGVYVNFAHRFVYDPAFTGAARGANLFGLDGVALPSFGFMYGATDKLSFSAYRSPSLINRPIQLMAAYSLLDEHKDAPFNLKARFSVEGQDNFQKNFTENLEAIISRSVTSRAQIYVVPTMSFNARPLSQGGIRSSDIANLPGFNTFSLGIGVAVDIRPTVALLAEVIPTLANGSELGIHRPAYSFGIQKKILRHAFTLGLTTGPGTTVSQRAGTRAEFLHDPGADTPGGLFLGFDLTRQIH
jgi:mono/diheme cytochrome c family protein